MMTDSWYIGAFGKWWRGGVIEAWYQDIVARSKDEESWNSGILTMKALDKFGEYNGVFSSLTLGCRFSLTSRPCRPSIFHQEWSNLYACTWLSP